jgi:hypothetical protein
MKNFDAIDDTKKNHQIVLILKQATPRNYELQICCKQTISDIIFIPGEEM